MQHKTLKQIFQQRYSEKMQALIRASLEHSLLCLRLLGLPRQGFLQSYKNLRPLRALSLKTLLPVATPSSQVHPQLASLVPKLLSFRLKQPLEPPPQEDPKASAVLALCLALTCPRKVACLSRLPISVVACSQHSLIPMVVAECSAATRHKTSVLR